MKTTTILPILALLFASCQPLSPVVDAKGNPIDAAPFNPLDEPGGAGPGTVNFDAYSNHGRSAPNAEIRREIGLYGY